MKIIRNEPIKIKTSKQTNEQTKSKQAEGTELSTAYLSLSMYMYMFNEQPAYL